MGERQADIAEADDADLQRAGLDTGLEFAIRLDGDTNVHSGDFTARVALGQETSTMTNPGPARLRVSKTERFPR